MPICKPSTSPRGPPSIVSASLQNDNSASPDLSYGRRDGGPAMLLSFMLVPLLLGSFAFWIWMIIDCSTNEPPTGNDKLAWIVIIVFTQIVGALIYYFVR